MKKYLAAVIALVLAFSLQAQLPELPSILQEKLDQEQLDLTINYDEIDQDKSEEQYYKFINRDTGNDTLLGYRWNRHTEEWMLHARIIKIYNDAEQVTDKYFQFYTDNGHWKEGLYFDYAYNDAGKPLEMIIQHWSEDASNWINHFKKSHFYNDAGQLSKIRTQWWSRWHHEWINHHLKKFVWNGDILVADTVKVHRPMMDRWMYHHYNSYSYTDAGKKTSKTRYTLRHHHNDWMKTTRFTYHYDDSGELLITVVNQKWFGDDGGWKNLHRYNYSYNDGSHVIVSIIENWNHHHFIWIEKRKIEYGYNDAGWMNHIVWRAKHSPDANWSNIKQANISYDDGGNMNEKIIQLWNHHHHLWVNFKKWTMLMQYYAIAGQDDNAKTDIKAIFPNPYSSGDMISFSGLEEGNYRLQLFDVRGTLIETKEILKNGKVYFSSKLPNGLYIMVVSDKSGYLIKTKLIVNQ